VENKLFENWIHKQFGFECLCYLTAKIINTRFVISGVEKTTTLLMMRSWF